MSEIAMKDLKPGIYQDIPNAIYQTGIDYEKHTVEHVSNSFMGKVAKCPANAFIPYKASVDLDFGAAFHPYILESEEDMLRVCYVEPTLIGTRAKTDNKILLAKYAAMNKGKFAIKPEAFETLKVMKKSIAGHSASTKLMKDGIAEQTVIWQDEETGLMCKCRPDWVPTGDYGVVDLKSSKSATRRGFKSSCYSYGYFRQAAFYLDGMAAIGQPKEFFSFIVVEKTAPYMVGVIVMEEEDIMRGRDEYRAILQRIKTCKDEGFWPNYESEGPIGLNDDGGI